MRGNKKPLVGIPKRGFVLKVLLFKTEYRHPLHQVMRH